jgi:putative chitinase
MAEITRTTFRQAFPHAVQPDQWADALAVEAPRVGINNPRRICQFLSQLGHESGGFTMFEENLNYRTPSRLDAIFSKVNGEADAAALIAKGPRAIANRVYSGRNGNGDEASGDGFKYRGMGPIQLTGRTNYSRAADRSGIDLVGNPEQVLSPAIGAKVAADYWRACDLNDEADNKEFIEITRAINGGALLGLEQRKAEYLRLRTIWVN